MTQVNLNELTKQEQCLLRELAERSKHALYYKDKNGLVTVFEDKPVLEQETMFTNYGFQSYTKDFLEINAITLENFNLDWDTDFEQAQIPFASLKVEEIYKFA